MIEILEKYSDKSLIKFIMITLLIILLTIYVSNKKSFFIYYGEPTNIKLENYCLDSIDEYECEDIGNFIPHKIKYLAFHCTASPEGKDFEDYQILDWFKQRGWNRPGYHKVIHLDGRCKDFVNMNEDNFIQYDELVNGVRGYNSSTISIAYIGGVDKYGNPKDTRTYSQKILIQYFIDYYKQKYPWIIIRGHGQFPGIKKACPSFKL